MLAGANANADVFAYGRDTAQGLFSVYAMRMAAVFTLSVSTVGLRTSALPRWVSYVGYLMASGGSRRAALDTTRVSKLGFAGESGDSLRPAAQARQHTRGRS
jgi:hypothetical protein